MHLGWEHPYADKNKTSNCLAHWRHFLAKERVQSDVVARPSATSARRWRHNWADDSDTVYLKRVYLNSGILELFWWRFQFVMRVCAYCLQTLHSYRNQMSTSEAEQISLVGLRSGRLKQSAEKLWEKKVTPPPKKNKFQVVYLWLGWQSESYPLLCCGSPAKERFKGWAIFKPVDTVTVLSLELSGISCICSQAPPAENPPPPQICVYSCRNTPLCRFLLLQNHFGVTHFFYFSSLRV